MTPFAAWEQRMGFPTQAACAEAIGMTRIQVWRLRHGERQPSPTLERLMEALERLKTEHG